MANPDFFKPAFDALAQDNAIGDPRGLPAYAYLRVSSKGQAEEGRSGLPRQVEHCHEIAARSGLRIAWEMVYADDDTGVEFEHRPQLTALRREIVSARRGQAVVMEYLDRLSRNADWHQGFLLDELQRAGMQVLFWKQFTSRVERMVLGAISQDGMEDAKARMREGKRQKALSGRVTTSRAAYGYEFVDAQGRAGETARRDTHYGIYEPQAIIAREIFERLAYKGETAIAIATDLNRRGVHPPGRGRVWFNATITAIVHAEIYKGEYYANRWTVRRWKDVDEFGKEHKHAVSEERPREEWIFVPVPPLVDPGTWALANANLGKNKQTAQRNAATPYLLTGLLRCAVCGYTWYGYEKHRTWVRKRTGEQMASSRRDYYCVRYTNGGKNVGWARCMSRPIPADLLEGAVWMAVWSTLRNRERMTRALDKITASDKNVRLLDEIAYLEREIAGAPNEDAIIIAGYKSGGFNADEFAAQRRALKTKIAGWQAEIADKRRQVVTPEQAEAKRRQILAQVEEAQRLKADAPEDAKRRVIHTFVDKIYVEANEGWFLIEGVIRGTFRFWHDGEAAQSAPDERDDGADSKGFVGPNLSQLHIKIVYSLREEMVTDVSVTI